MRVASPSLVSTTSHNDVKEALSKYHPSAHDVCDSFRRHPSPSCPLRSSFDSSMNRTSNAMLLFTCTRRYTFRICVLAVPGVVPTASAISLWFIPRHRSFTTCTSRGVIPYFSRNISHCPSLISAGNGGSSRGASRRGSLCLLALIVIAHFTAYVTRFKAKVKNRLSNRLSATTCPKHHPGHS